MKKVVENKRKSIIKVRGGYSDSMGLDSVNKLLQIEEFDNRTRTMLCNVLRELLEEIFEHDYHLGRYTYSSIGLSNSFCKEILSEVFAELITLGQGRSYAWRIVYDEQIADVILNGFYNEVLDITWYICKWISENMKYPHEGHYKVLNNFFEKECVGYRFVSGNIIRITDEVEIAEIEMAVASNYLGASEHLKKAVALLADRDNKDYKNCIKESISAVESVCKVIIGKENATLGEALRVLESKRGLKGQLKAAFEKLYNYTNGQGGIRHAEGLFVSEVTHEEAKFMLVSCSAFVNYMIAEYGKINSGV